MALPFVRPRFFGLLSTSHSLWAEGTVSGSNSLVGASAGTSITTGTDDSFFDFQAGFDNTSGELNSFFGRLAGTNNTTDSGNSFFGADSGGNNTTGSTNSMFGQASGVNHTTGAFNTFIGAFGGAGNTIEDLNTLLGAFSDLAGGITNATAIGADARVEQSNSLVLGSIAGVGLAVANVGIGTTAPQSPLHVSRDDNSANLLVEKAGTGANRNLLTLRKLTNAPFVRYESQFRTWDFTGGNFFSIDDPSDGPIEFLIDGAGNLTLTGTLTENSSRAVKQDIEPVDVQTVLAKVLALPIAEWQYCEGRAVRHMGPMAEDFHAAFGLGRDDKGISTLDTSGVALAAIQGLKAEQEALRAEKDEDISELKALYRRQIEALYAQYETLQTKLARLEVLLEARLAER